MTTNPITTNPAADVTPPALSLRTGAAGIGQPGWTRPGSPR